MEISKEVPPIYKEYESININITITPLGHKYGMILQGIGGRLEQKIDMLPDDLYQVNNRIRTAFHEVAFSEITGNKNIRKLAEEGYNAFLRVFDTEARDVFRKLLTYSGN